MSEPLDENTRAAIKAFEDADDMFRLHPHCIWGTESERKAALYSALRQKWKAWEHSGKCMYRGCGKNTIAHSHSIHRAGPLEQIAEQQHVLTPEFGENGTSLKRIGVRVASTFPGFCETHEQLFIQFERAGRIADGHQTVLQAFRTLCREIARKRHDVEHLKQGLAAYREVRFNYFRNSILSAAPDVETQSVSEEGNKLEDTSVSLIAEAEEDLKELEGELYGELFQYIDGGPPEPCVSAIEISPDIPLEIPVALSGLGVLRYSNSAGQHRALCLLGILPQERTTLAFIAAARRHSDAIAMYVRRMMASFGALNSMESWMVNGSDHWFVRPSAWQAIPKARRSTILKALEGVEYSIGSLPPFSILDDARRRLIRYLREHIDETDDRKAALRQLAIEEAKLVAR